MFLSLAQRPGIRPQSPKELKDRGVQVPSKIPTVHALPQLGRKEHVNEWWRSQLLRRRLCGSKRSLTFFCVTYAGSSGKHT